MNEFNEFNEQSKSTEESLKNEKRGASAAKSRSGLKGLLAKRWFSPALFMAAAAIIVTLMWVYQGNTDEPTGTGVTEGEDLTQEGNIADEADVTVEEELTPAELAATGEDMQWPVMNVEALQVSTPFYDSKASATEREAALIQVGTTYAPHMGVDFVDSEGESFDVVSALSGKVTLVETNPVTGNVVEISHGNGLVTVYQSLADVSVQEGDEVEQGTIIAIAGQSDLERDLGIHLHFETRLNGGNVNPNDYILE